MVSLICVAQTFIMHINLISHLNLPLCLFATKYITDSTNIIIDLFDVTHYFQSYHTFTLLHLTTTCAQSNCYLGYLPNKEEDNSGNYFLQMLFPLSKEIHIALLLSLNCLNNTPFKERLSRYYPFATCVLIPISVHPVIFL